MNCNNSEKSDWRYRLKSFSDSMFRNCQIVRKRWEISALEKRRKLEVVRLGNLVYRLYGKKTLSLQELEPQIKRVEKIDAELKVLEERLRDLIIKADLPRQLTAGDKEAKKETVPAGAPEKTPTAESISDVVKPSETHVLSDRKKPETSDKPKSVTPDTSSSKSAAEESVRQVMEKVVTNAAVKDKKTSGGGLQETAQTPKAASGTKRPQGSKDNRTTTSDKK